jgi:hypothetical protein
VGLGVARAEFRRWATEAVADVPGGLRGHLILAAIAHGCPPSQLALAPPLGFDKSAMTSLVGGLERAQLLERLLSILGNSERRCTSEPCWRRSPIRHYQGRPRRTQSPIRCHYRGATLR